MTYAVQQDLIDRFGIDELVQLTDDDQTGAINATRVTQVLADTDARIDGYIAARYALPLSVVPPALTVYACDIARYLLAKNVPTEEMKRRYDSAIKFLGDVGKGTLSLVGDNGASAGEANGPVVAQGARRVFSPQRLRDFTEPWDWAGDEYGRRGPMRP